MKLQAVNNYVGIKPIVAKDIKLGAIELPVTEQRIERWAEVSSVGPGVPDAKGNPIPLDLDEGDIVYCMAHGKEDILTAAGVKSGIAGISVIDILAKLEDDKSMKIKPLGSYVEVEKLDSDEVLKEGQIELPGSLTLPTNFAKVLTLGTGWRTPYGDPIPFHVKEGDIVAYHPFQTMEVDMHQLGEDGTKFILRHADIIGIVDMD